MKKSKELTTERLNLMQPNKVTNAKYEYTAVQENVVTLIIESIQDHLTQKKPIETDLFNHPIRTIKAGEVAQGHSKHYVIQQLRDLRKREIFFEYTDQNKQKRHNIGAIINNIDYVSGDDYVRVEINVRAIPYLLYWGKGVGGTIFQKVMALRLKGYYTKRLYKLCCRWQDQGGFNMSIEKFREIYGLEDKYNRITDLKRWVLDPAKKELKEKADLYFEYKMEKIKSRSYNNISFKIFSQKAQPNENMDQWYRYVYNFISRTYPSYKDDKAMNMTEKLASDSSVLRQAYNKFIKLDDQFTKGEKSKGDLIKLTKHILKNDFKLK